jgi:hypothetical protein
MNFRDKKIEFFGQMTCFKQYLAMNRPILGENTSAVKVQKKPRRIVPPGLRI